MSFVPSFKLYDSTGLNLVHTFEIVTYTNAPQSISKTVEIEGQRGIGSLIIDGGTAPWDLIIRGVLTTEEEQGSEAYKDLTSKIDTLESLSINTPYILRIDKDESSYYEYKVKRIDPINYPESLRTSSQIYEVTLRVNSWS